MRQKQNTQKRREQESRVSQESGVRLRLRRGSIERAVIGTLALGGILTVAVMAPKVAALIKREHLDVILPPQPTQRLRETLSRLKKKGMVEFMRHSGKRYPILTERGKSHAERIRLSAVEIPRPRRWDGRWRVVIFDIPHARRSTRDRVREILKRLGFHRLQNSVWVHPYDCEEIITLLKLDASLRTEVRYIIADAIEYDKPLRVHFGLGER